MCRRGCDGGKTQFAYGGIHLQQGQENSQKDNKSNQPPQPELGAVIAHSVSFPHSLVCGLDIFELLHLSPFSLARSRNTLFEIHRITWLGAV